MKKILCFILCLVMISALTACGGDEKEEEKTTSYTYEIGLLAASPEASIDDGDEVEAAWEGVRKFAEEQGKAYKYYEAETAEADSQVASVDQAVADGVKVIVAVGSEVKEGIEAARKKYDDVTFIYLDGELEKGGTNSISVSFDALQAGFLAGYSAVIEGFYNMGYLADGESEEAVAYGYGFLQGANQAAMNFSRYSLIRYDYGEKDASAESIREKAKKWYDEGAVAIFTYGADVFDAVKTVAEEAEKVVMASNAAKSYNKTVITSAMKNFEAVVTEQLTAVYDGSFVGGETIKMNVKNGGVGLDMKESKFEYFNEEQYKDICDRISKGEQEILSQRDAKTIDDLIKAQWMYYIRIEEQ